MSKHKFLSFVKSGIRIAGLIWLLTDIPTGILLLLIAEIVGVMEEL
jgi:hypothetical protein